MFLENFFCDGLLRGWLTCNRARISRVCRVHVVSEVSDCLSDEIEFTLRRKRKDHF